MKRSVHDLGPVCHWCKQPVNLDSVKKTLPAFTDWPWLPTGTGVIVCGDKCDKRPAGAPVGTNIRGEQQWTVNT